jgi:hypothetical protein
MLSATQGSTTRSPSISAAGTEHFLHDSLEAQEFDISKFFDLTDHKTLNQQNVRECIETIKPYYHVALEKSSGDQKKRLIYAFNEISEARKQARAVMQEKREIFFKALNPGVSTSPESNLPEIQELIGDYKTNVGNRTVTAEQEAAFKDIMSTRRQCMKKLAAACNVTAREINTNLANSIGRFYGGPSDSHQVAQIRCMPSEYISLAASGHGVSLQDAIKAYIREFEIPTMVELASSSAGENRLAELNRAYKNFTNAYKTAHEKNTGEEALGNLEVLITTVNKILTEKPINLNSGYEPSAESCWHTVDIAIKNAVPLCVGEPVRPQDPNGKKIPTIPYSQVQKEFPSPLCRLIRDIYYCWKFDKVFDQRTEVEQNGKTITSEIAGSLRSWHLNARGTLPEIVMTFVDQAAGCKLAEHYRNTSKVPGNIDLPTTGPIGYAEYTGAGIANDAHNCKIVLDYTSGKLYFTLTHYQHWRNDNGEIKTTGQDIKPDIDEHAPWFMIDMQIQSQAGS